MGLLGDVGSLYMLILIALLVIGLGLVGLWFFKSLFGADENKKRADNINVRNYKNGGFVMNSWLRLALFSFAGIIIAMTVLALISPGGMLGYNNNHGAMNQQMQSGMNMNNSMSGGGMGMMNMPMNNSAGSGGMGMMNMPMNNSMGSGGMGMMNMPMNNSMGSGGMGMMNMPMNNSMGSGGMGMMNMPMGGSAQMQTGMPSYNMPMTNDPMMMMLYQMQMQMNQMQQQIQQMNSGGGGSMSGGGMGMM